MLMTALFKAGLDRLDNSIRERVPKTLRLIEQDPYYPGDELQERKLFYLSMTRAAEHLYLLHPQRKRCPFLYDLGPATIAKMER